MTVVLESRQRIAYAEAHFSVTPLNAYLTHQGSKIRVSTVIKNNKTGVNGILLPLNFNINGVGMATDIIVALKQFDLMLFA